MKLSALNAAIDAAPKVFGRTKFGLVAFEKGSLKAALKETFSGQRTAETGVYLDAGHCLASEPAACALCGQVHPPTPGWCQAA